MSESHLEGLRGSAIWYRRSNNTCILSLCPPTGEAETDPTTYPFITRFKNWGGYPFDYPCEGGKRVRLICILSTGDLPLLDQRPELFANKFYSDYSHVALGCLAERIFNHTRDEYLGNMEFNTSYYAGLPFVTNTVKTSTFNRTS